MTRQLTAKELRTTLPDVVARVQKGERFVVVYRSRPVMQLVPLGVSDGPNAGDDLASNPLYRAEGLGSSTDGLHSEDHDAVLYGTAKRRRRTAGTRRR
jgi:antitoxin (DNA-binding transcriptional repressor) of toxin-antitoxin stability system